MADPFTVELDSSRLNSRIAELHDALIGAGQAGDAATIFEDESRRFLQQVIRLTPPKTKQQGEARIEKDLTKIFTAVNEDMLNTIGSEHGLSAIDVWLTTAGGEKKQLDWRRIDPTGSGMAAFHNQNRDSRGRAKNLKRQFGTKWYAPYVVSFEDMAAYRDKIKSHVGRKKAAWAKSFAALGGKVASWIGRHQAGAKGEFHNSYSLEKPNLVMISRAPGVSQDLHFIRGAMRVRYEAIGRRIRLVLSGYSKDMASGMKIQRRARKSSESLEAA